MEEKQDTASQTIWKSVFKGTPDEASIVASILDKQVELKVKIEAEPALSPQRSGRDCISMVSVLVPKYFADKARSILANAKTNRIELNGTH